MAKKGEGNLASLERVSNKIIIWCSIGSGDADA